MNILVKRTIKWFWKAWPLHYLIIIGLIHYTFLKSFPHAISEINSGISLLLQIIGGLLILYSIDSNTGVINNDNLIGIFKSYLKQFPPIHTYNTTQIKAAITQITTYPPKSRVIMHPTSIEDKLAYLQEQIEDLRWENEYLQKSLSDQIKEQSVEIYKDISDIKVKLRENYGKLEKVSVGSIKIQIFGVFLMLYGAIAGY
jgi:hypothetical protein